MVLQLIRDAQGNYTYKDAMEASAPTITSSEFEAYTGGSKTTLAGATDLGTQTATLLRETPGPTTLNIDPNTGQTTTKTNVTPTAIDEKGFATQLPTTTVESPLEKAARIAQAFPMQQTGGPSPQDFLGQIQSMQNKQLKADRINTLIKGGVDLGVNYLNLGRTLPGTTGTVTPLSGGTFGSSSFMQGAGGAAVAGGLGYGISRALGGDKKESQMAGAGAAIGTAVGGPVGGVVGGVIGKVIGCFLPDTLISMNDGSKKKIIDIELKDNVAVGGFVFATGKFLVNDIYDYKGVKVSGSHLVNEKGSWLKVQDSKLAKLISTKDTVVYTLGTKNRRILINDILFTDYFDIDEQQKMAS
jgi:hypothetical protein